MSHDIYQFIDPLNGARSEPFVADIERLCEVIVRHVDESPECRQFLLMHVASCEEDGQFVIVTRPLITLERFLSFFSGSVAEDSENG